MPNKTSKVTNQKQSYQMRLTINEKIYNDILKARKKYKYLDDVEIIKIFIGLGSDVEFGEEKQFELLSHTNFNDEEDFTGKYKTTGKKLNWN